jgi:flavin reductase (DIM6/NTAB) family NADH-FMN oxidoreductase RutF
MGFIGRADRQDVRIAEAGTVWKVEVEPSATVVMAVIRGRAMQSDICAGKPAAVGIPPAAFRKTMRNLAGTVAIVTSGRDDCRRGLTITALCSLSADPPSLAVCVNRKAEAHDVIASEGCFGVSILAAEHAGLARSFAGQDGSKGVARFLSHRWTQLETRAPLLEDAVTIIDCRVMKQIDVGTHSLFCGLIVATRDKEATRPLLHYDGEFVLLA